MNFKIEQILPNVDDLERSLTEKGFHAICGVDEVGRGPLAGPVVAAAVVFPQELEIHGLDDSKKLSPQQRQRIFDEIIELGLPCAVGAIDNNDIDRMNIHRASLMAMRKAVMDLKIAPEVVLVDGRHCIPKLSFPQYAVVSGDSRCRSIAAASIIAKVTRDRIMDKMQMLYPEFTFSQHKGYPTPAHLEELQRYGPCEIHRRSFKPVAELVEEYVLL